MSQTYVPTKDTSSSRVWFLTGSSSGLGRALAEAVLAHGDRLVATARHPEQLEDLTLLYPNRLLTAQLDIMSEEQSKAAVAQAMKTFGRIDVLVNNAGFGLFGAVEEASAAEVRQHFETNVFGPLNVTRAVLPVLRAQRQGHILMLSSLSGIVSTMGMGMYNASKFAIEGFSGALAQEIAPLGIHLTLIEPGMLRTDFTGRSLKMAQHTIGDYAQTSGMVIEWNKQHVNGKQQGDPARAAQAMIKVVESPEPPLRLVLGADALEMIRKNLASMEQEMKVWEATSLSTAFSNEKVSS
ncbi:SDR family NAD(P)-dependent oxidoreductase [Ktedonosporobacter rubrisoli]|uniref:SDR family NAD(P)-dependent oxidoreductase n=1 Tax=Ktedonosporobacter rubrisoli TaxID=2509675 RepID=A0A4P6JWP0_KTERU|nr:oxidoreductase [Ktedonosporobacter rubrisoli]QBD80119.1 SDR family NAD(P)-dependent oxidoreductase [Ktedonosporobacter rubrisoli]